MLNSSSLLTIIKNKFRTEAGVDPIRIPPGLVPVHINVDLNTAESAFLLMADAELDLMEFPANTFLMYANWSHPTLVSLDSGSQLDLEVQLEGTGILDLAGTDATSFEFAAVGGQSLKLVTKYPAATPGYTNTERPAYPLAGFSADIYLLLFVDSFYEQHERHLTIDGSNDVSIELTVGNHGSVANDRTSDTASNETISFIAPCNNDITFTATPDVLYNTDTWTCAVGTPSGDTYTITWEELLAAKQAGTTITISVTFVAE